MGARGGEKVQVAKQQLSNINISFMPMRQNSNLSFYSQGRGQSSRGTGGWAWATLGGEGGRRRSLGGRSPAEWLCGFEEQSWVETEVRIHIFSQNFMLQVHDNVNYFRPKLPLNLKGVKVRYFHVHIHIYTLRTLIIYTHNHFRPKIARKTSELALSLSLSNSLSLLNQPGPS